MKSVLYIAVPLCLCAGSPLRAEAATASPRGRWQVTALTPRVLMLVGDYSDFLRKTYLLRWSDRKKSLSENAPEWLREQAFHTAGTEAVLGFRPELVRRLSSGGHRIFSAAGGELKTIGFGYWLNPTGLVRCEIAPGRERISRNAEVVHYLFLTLERPLKEGESLRIVLSSGQEISFVYSADTPSPLFKINQLGYMPHAGRKYAYLGAWLGTGGPLELNGEYIFELVDKNTGRPVFSGSVRPRMKDPVTAAGAPFTGENVLELDFSAFKTPGRYFLRITGIGRSEEFAVGSQGMAESFFIHARGLYHKRCGIAKARPHTRWETPACHLRVLRGSFPPHDGHYRTGSGHSGFFDRTGKRVAVNHFKLIAADQKYRRDFLEIRGGWHDAADCDRRPQHMTVVGDLAAVYMLRPRNFCDGQLNIPESGNGVPDILDEASWGLEHIRQGQSPDGGTGTWIETTRHPDEKDGLPSEEPLIYTLSRATRQSTIEYCAYAAELALALRAAGAAERSDRFARSAERAWDFAMEPKNLRTSFHPCGDGESVRMLLYREPRHPAAEFVVKAGAALHLLTGKSRYLDTAVRHIADAIAAHKKSGWSWSPFFWATLEIHSRKLAPLEELRRIRREAVVRQADRMLRQLDTAYPYRIPWFEPGSGWEHSMAWGTCHPLRRALTLTAAHAFTGERKYLDGALLANDYHNGANPNGATMTSGLGRVYPVRFLDLTSYLDGIGEFVPGITPFRHTFGIAPADVRMAHGLFYPPRKELGFAGCAVSFLPEAKLTEKECAGRLNLVWPVWRRWANLESHSVPDSEYTVWETIGPAAAVTGYLLERGEPPRAEWLERKPASDLRTLPGYTPLP